MTLSQIDEMDIGLYFRLMRRNANSKQDGEAAMGYIDQVL